MGRELDREIARTLEAPSALLPLLPELLADLDGLGSLHSEVFAILEPLELSPSTRILDLGCGKGEVGIALCERSGCSLMGIDAFLPFVEEARQRALTAGLGERAVFRQEDLRQELARPGQVDLLLFLGLGPLLGDAGRTVARLREKVRPGGHLLIDDAYLTEESVPGFEAYSRRETTLARLQSCGDQLVDERLPPRELIERLNRVTNERVKERARVLAERHPELEGLLFEFVSEQERSALCDETALRPALWLLRRGPAAGH